MCRKDRRQIESVLHGDIQNVGEITALNWDNIQYPLYAKTVHCCIHNPNAIWDSNKERQRQRVFINPVLNCFPNLFLLGSVELWENCKSLFCLTKQNLTFFFWTPTSHPQQKNIQACSISVASVLVMESAPAGVSCTFVETPLTTDATGVNAWFQGIVCWYISIHHPPLYPLTVLQGVWS